MATKQCSKCGAAKPLADYWMKRPEKGQLYAQCKQCLGARHSQWWKSNRHKNAGYAAHWKATSGIEHVRAVWRNLRRKRVENPACRISARVSTAVYRSLRGYRKMRPTWELLGYSRETLMAHLEKQFASGMTWKNYGEWHIDHIVPQASFNITSSDCDDFRALWALSNLRPLWAAENIRKKDTRTHLL